jgi:hypothetical protein
MDSEYQVIKCEWTGLYASSRSWTDGSFRDSHRDGHQLSKEGVDSLQECEKVVKQRLSFCDEGVVANQRALHRVLPARDDPRVVCLSNRPWVALVDYCVRCL